MPRRIRPWYRMQADGASAEILIYDEIGRSFWNDGAVGAKQFADDLKALGAITDLAIRINSPGGDVFEGTAIYNQLKNHPARKTVHVDGLAASIASVIAMAGDQIIMAENAMLMIHDPTGFAIGTADDLRATAEALEKIKSVMAGTYARRTGLPLADVGALMTAETWLTPEEAKEKGFADAVGAPVEAAASFDLDQFRHVPKPWAQRWAATAAGAHDPARKENSMPNEKPVTLELITEQHPQIAAALREEGRTAGQEAAKKDGYEAGLKDGAARERARIQGVRAQHLAGHEALIETCMFDGVTTGEQAAAKVLEAERTARGQTLRALYAEAPKPVPAAEPGSMPSPQGGDEASWTSDWERNVGHVQQEFTGLAAFLAYKKAHQRGGVKILGVKTGTA